MRSFSQNRYTRYGNMAPQTKFKKQSESIDIKGNLKQIRIKHFVLVGKENKGVPLLKSRIGTRKESNYILKQKYANLRFMGKL